MLVALSKICEQNDISLIVLRQYGLIGSVRLYAKEICAIESKPAEVQIDDLRLVNPFPALKEFADSINMSVMDNKEHGHCPFAVILIQILEQWKAEVK